MRQGSFEVLPHILVGLVALHKTQARKEPSRIRVDHKNRATKRVENDIVRRLRSDAMDTQ